MHLNHDDRFPSSALALLNGLRRDFERPLGNGHTVATYVPAVDIVEEAKRYLIRADLPGVDAAAIDITVEGDVLKIAGERRSASLPTDEQAEASVKPLRVERGRGRFERTFRLPEAVRADGVAAEYRDGVLTIEVPKVEPYRIEVTAN